MWDWLKNLFGAAEQVVTLAEKHAEASKLASRALDTFNYVVKDLETAAFDLQAIAAEADAEAKVLVTRATDAAGEAEKNLARAAKIRALLD